MSVSYNQYPFQNLFAMSNRVINAFVKLKGKSDRPTIFFYIYCCNKSETSMYVLMYDLVCQKCEVFLFLLTFQHPVSETFLSHIILSSTIL